MKKEIQHKVKLIYKSQHKFLAQSGLKSNNFFSKVRTMENKVSTVNAFLEPLELKMVMVDLNIK